jgi:DNA repair exonuclease SbcCD ATPase subunit
MKISYVEAHGFRGYRNRVRFTFGERFTVVDGRNGAGKSTIFDAIEFALTGHISKYNDAKADGETVADYIWWTGEGFPSGDRYVEVGFKDTDSESDIVVRRSQLAGPDESVMQQVLAGLCDLRTAPKAPLSQLCASTIIRDEHITSLSLDLKEIDRYALLREALGATDSEEWIQRAAQLVSAATQRMKAAEAGVVAANSDAVSAARRLDEIRANLSDDATLAEAVARMREFTKSSGSADELAGPARQRLADVGEEIRRLREVADQSSTIAAMRQQLAQLNSTVAQATDAAEAARENLDSLAVAEPQLPQLAPGEVAQSIMQLVSLGRRIGLQDGHCPLCASGQSASKFEAGLRRAEELANRLDEESARLERIKEQRSTAETEAQSAEAFLAASKMRLESTADVINVFERNLGELGLTDSEVEIVARKRANDLERTVDVARRDLRVLDTLRFNEALESAQTSFADANSRVARAQEAFGTAQRAHTTAHALHDATRRASAETLEQRLERVLPLMAELYRRLRPHPIWNDIEYSIRGDVKRFLKLKVGDDLNPQFLFSSGQRRATGIAFLLAVNLSLAWSRWRSILLDDPVQHVDDFRAVHLAEVAAQLVEDERQIICAVEDSALADLLCRRLPISQIGDGRRITLGNDAEGSIAKLVDRALPPLLRHTFLEPRDIRVAG